MARGYYGVDPTQKRRITLVMARRDKQLRGKIENKIAMPAIVPFAGDLLRFYACYWCCLPTICLPLSAVLKRKYLKSR